MTETKMKPVAWHERPRINRLASILYPGLADDQAKRDMERFSRQEGKHSPMDMRGGTIERPSPRSGTEFSGDYSRVPGLVRKRR